jgi:hypothetical protein
MKHSENISEIAKAILHVQGQIGKVKKDTKGVFGKYSSLDHVIDIVRPILVDAGIAVTQCIDRDVDSYTLSTTLIHAESGQWIRSSGYPLKAAASQRNNEAQAMGIAITYARRYCLLAILNIAPGDDDDGAGAGPTTYERGKELVEAAEAAMPAKPVAQPVGDKPAKKNRFAEAVEMINARQSSDKPFDQEAIMKARMWVSKLLEDDEITAIEQTKLNNQLAALETANAKS